MFFIKKYQIIDITNNTYLSFISEKSHRMSDSYKKAISFNKREAESIVSKLQKNLEFVKYQIIC